MRQVKTESCHVVFVTGLFLTGLFFVAACSTPDTVQAPPATGVTVFEGARLIAGDGGEPIEDAAPAARAERPCRSTSRLGRDAPYLPF
jgi:hypothetical protein